MCDTTVLPAAVVRSGQCLVQS
eukprot:COSAG01_NODE_47397_length_390_cov_3.542955_2_plen_21_part_01